MQTRITYTGIDPRTDTIEVLDRIRDYLDRLAPEDRAAITITAEEE